MKNSNFFVLRIIFGFLLMANITFAHAQNSNVASGGNPVDNMLRSNGLIYVVVGVIVIILGGLIVYLRSIDKKLTKLEKEIQDPQ